LNLLCRQGRSCGSHGHTLEAADRRRIDSEGAGYVDQALAISEPLEGLLALIGIELVGPAELHALVLRPLPAVVGAGLDQVALEGGEAGQDGHKQRQCSLRVPLPFPSTYKMR
jgi:hypothetical protein